MAFSISILSERDEEVGDKTVFTESREDYQAVCFKINCAHGHGVGHLGIDEYQRGGVCVCVGGDKRDNSTVKRFTAPLVAINHHTATQASLLLSPETLSSSFT